MVVKVYGAVMTACPQRVLACLVEKGLEFEVVHVDLDFGEQKRPEFLIRQVRNCMKDFACPNRDIQWHGAYIYRLKKYLFAIIFYQIRYRSILEHFLMY